MPRFLNDAMGICPLYLFLLFGKRRENCLSRSFPLRKQDTKKAAYINYKRLFEGVPKAGLEPARASSHVPET
ncbi:MAG: hypothetical protein WD098_11655 [Balneolales bacterium]